MNPAEKAFPVLVPVDFSTATGRVVETAVEYARALRGSVRLLYVCEPVPGMVPQEDLGVMPMLQPAAPMPERSQVGRLEEWRRKLAGCGVAVEVTERRGSVVHEICEQAREDKASLIVMGSHGHGAMYDLLVGSAAHGVLKQAACPVLIVPVEGR